MPGVYAWSPDPFLQFRDEQAKPLGGGSLFIYVAGTSTPAPTYSDIGLQVLNPNPIVLSSDGRNPAGPIFLEQGNRYRYILQDRDGNTVLTRDNILGGTVASLPGVSPQQANFIAQGRLTLVSGDPVNADTDAIGADTVYYAPYQGSSIALFDSATGWAMYSFPQLAMPLSDLGLDVGMVCDVFAHANAEGVVTLEAIPWATPTIRATPLAVQDGVYVWGDDPGSRYLGSFATSDSGLVTEDSTVRRFLYNAQNRTTKALIRLETTASWQYDLPDVVRQANANPLNQVSVLQGLQEDAIEVSLGVFADVIDMRVGIGIGIDVPVIDTIRSFGGSFSAEVNPTTVQLATKWSGYLVGRHDLLWLEYYIPDAGNVSLPTWWSHQPRFASGMIGSCRC